MASPSSTISVAESPSPAITPGLMQLQLSADHHSPSVTSSPSALMTFCLSYALCSSSPIIVIVDFLHSSPPFTIGFHTLPFQHKVHLLTSSPSSCTGSPPSAPVPVQWNVCGRNPMVGLASSTTNSVSPSVLPSPNRTILFPYLNWTPFLQSKCLTRTSSPFYTFLSPLLPLHRISRTFSKRKLIKIRMTFLHPSTSLPLPSLQPPLLLLSSQTEASLLFSPSNLSTCPSDTIPSPEPL